VRSPHRESGWISHPDRWIHEALLTLLRLRKSHHAIAEMLDRRLAMRRWLSMSPMTRLRTETGDPIHRLAAV
jgi:hypothetical protein